MKKSNIKGSAILLIAALIWGIAFVAQSEAADKIPPFAFNSLRSFIGAGFIYVFLISKSKINKTSAFKNEASYKKTAVTGGIVCGILLFISINLQQWGITVYPAGVASAARSGFITALYVIIVPLISVFTRKKISPILWLAVILAVAGVYMLCLSGGIDGIYIGDFLVFLCAVSFSLHIIAVDKYGVLIGGIQLSLIQFLVCAIISGAVSLIFEFGSFSGDNIISAAPQILFLGIMSSGVAYTLQIVGQRYAEPAVSSISMSFESVFAALGGWIILGNTLSTRELLGCAIMFIAIITAQIPEIRSRHSV